MYQLFRVSKNRNETKDSTDISENYWPVLIKNIIADILNNILANYVQ